MKDFIDFIVYLSKNAKDAERFFVIMSQPNVSKKELAEFFSSLKENFDFNDSHFDKLIEARKNMHDGFENLSNLKY